jgi:hypothetical protein
LFCALVLVAFSVCANATPISGGFSISSTGNVIVTGTTISWVPNPDGSNFLITSGTGDFGAASLSLGNLAPLTNGPFDQPVGSSFDYPFMSITNLPAYIFHLTYIYPGFSGDAQCGASPAAAAQVCTPPLPGGLLSPFNLSNSVNGSSASFEVKGEVRDSGTSEVLGTFTGQFGATFTGALNVNPPLNPWDAKSFQGLLAALNPTTDPPGPGFVTTSFSGTFDVVGIPEPGTIGMVLLGGLLIGVGQLRRRRSM